MLLYSALCVCSTTGQQQANFVRFIVLYRQSRLLKYDQTGYQLFTVDHNDSGRLRLDLQHSWAATDSPHPVVPEHELIPDANAGWLRSHLDCGITGSYDESSSGVQWMAAGPNVLLAVQQGMVVEYDLQMRSPVGVVAFLEEGEEDHACCGVYDRLW